MVSQLLSELQPRTRTSPPASTASVLSNYTKLRTAEWSVQQFWKRFAFLLHWEGVVIPRARFSPSFYSMVLCFHNCRSGSRTPTIHAYDVLPITLICKPFHIQPESLLLARSPMNCLRFISHKIIPNNRHHGSLSRLLNLYSIFFLFSGQWLDHSPFFIHLRYESTTFHGWSCRRCVHHLSRCNSRNWRVRIVTR